MTREEAIIHIGTLRTVTKDITKYSGKAIDKAVDMAIEALKELKTGHWEWVQYDKPPIGNWHCSECGRIVFLLNSQKSGEMPLYDFCPWCGVKMVEPQENEVRN